MTRETTISSDSARAEGLLLGLLGEALDERFLKTDARDTYVAAYQEARNLLRAQLDEQRRALLESGVLIESGSAVLELARARQALCQVQAVAAIALRRLTRHQVPEVRLWHALLGASRLGGVNPEGVALRCTQEGQLLAPVGQALLLGDLYGPSRYVQIVLTEQGELRAFPEERHG